MAAIFLSYRRTDAPQACRVYNALVGRFGADAVFMDVETIPFAVSFPEFIREAIADSKVLIALIGFEWAARIREEADPVRMEVETAIERRVPVLPVLIGNTTMPHPDALPTTLLSVSSQNAMTLGVLHDFDTHMRLLTTRIEALLGARSAERAVMSDPRVIERACAAVMRHLSLSYSDSSQASYGSPPDFAVVGASDFSGATRGANAITLFLHRVVKLTDLLELHFILSFWTQQSSMEHLLAGWVLRELEQTPMIPVATFGGVDDFNCNLKVRRSDEDARQVWKLITSDPLRLSLSYIATVSARTPQAQGSSERSTS
jgi:hypothetical protein